MEVQGMVEEKVFPRFMKFVKAAEIESKILELPAEFLDKYERNIPPSVRLQFPNGSQLCVQYIKSKRSLAKVGNLIKEFKLHSKAILVLTYKNDGLFLVNVFNEGYVEMQYAKTRSVPEGRVYPQDPRNGVGFSMLSNVIGHIQIHGGAHIHGNFLPWFRKHMPKNITLVFRDGSWVHGHYSVKDRKLYGLKPFFRQQEIKLFYILMFTYRGEGIFDVCIFDRKKIERVLDEDILFVGSGNENAGNLLANHLEDVIITAEHNIEGTSIGDELQIPAVNNGASAISGRFEVVMTASHVNGSSHGVYIPRQITPNKRSWMVGDEVILITRKGNWSVRLVMSNGLARFSGGWNSFVKANQIRRSNTLLFNLEEDDGRRCSFNIEIKKKVVTKK